MILKKTDKEMKLLFHKVKFAMEAMMKLMPDSAFTQSVKLSVYFYYVYNCSMKFLLKSKNIN